MKQVFIIKWKAKVYVAHHTIKKNPRLTTIPDDALGSRLASRLIYLPFYYSTWLVGFAFFFCPTQSTSYEHFNVRSLYSFTAQRQPWILHILVFPILSLGVILLLNSPQVQTVTLRFCTISVERIASMYTCRRLVETSIYSFFDE